MNVDLAVLAAGLTPAPTDEELGIPPWEPLDLDSPDPTFAAFLAEQNKEFRRFVAAFLAEEAKELDRFTKTLPPWEPLDLDPINDPI